MTRLSTPARFSALSGLSSMVPTCRRSARDAALVGDDARVAAIELRFAFGVEHDRDTGSRRTVVSAHLDNQRAVK